jgi:hypothetical protein
MDRGLSVAVSIADVMDRTLIRTALAEIGKLHHGNGYLSPSRRDSDQTCIKAQGSRFNLLLRRFGLGDSSIAITLLHGITESSGQFADCRRTLWNLDGLNTSEVGQDGPVSPGFQGVKLRRTTGNAQEASKKIRSTAE